MVVFKDPHAGMGGVVGVSVRGQELETLIFPVRNPFQFRVFSDSMIFLGFEVPWFAGTSLTQLLLSIWETLPVFDRWGSSNQG